ncbi:MAG: hypothetical protein HY569_01580 [Candidatus Magasanikbacteria bacterium]|nr:hypothetical protein [Candidatus Magasanikbacteria bacterium]
MEECIMNTDKTSTASTLPAAPTCTVIGSYQISTGETCELLVYTRPDGSRVKGIHEILTCGEADGASMGKADFHKFCKYIESFQLRSVGLPCIIFPKASDASGKVPCTHRYDEYWSTYYRDPNQVLSDYIVAIVRFCSF